MTAKIYQLSDPMINQDALGAHDPLVRRLLALRGINDAISADKFLNPKYEDISDPFLMHDMEKGVDRFIGALLGEETIGIFADFDADGVSSGTVMHDLMHIIGYDNFVIYIPHRHNEGYGISDDALKFFQTNNATLVITVDVGIGAVESVQKAKEMDIDFIVTDHHEPGEILPPAEAVINPKLGDYPDPMLCGAAVAWQFLRAVLYRLRAESLAPYSDKITAGIEKWSLDVVGLATIADMVPLLNENRILATYGLKVLRKTRRPGLRLFMKKIGVSQSNVNAMDIGFSIAPRINAASRMDHADIAFKVFTSSDQNEVKAGVDYLEDLNKQRKLQVANTVKAAKRRLEGRTLGSVIVIGDKDWNPGVTGLVAGKIADRFSRPAFVWTKGQDGNLKGSFRSVNGIDGLKLCTHLDEGILQSYGGHKAAGGFTIAFENIHTLEEKFSHAFEKHLQSDTEIDEFIHIDAELAVDDINDQVHQIIESLSPFGMANETPIFIFKNAQIKNSKTFGKTNNHFETRLESKNGREVRAIKFFSDGSDLTFLPKGGDTVDIIGSIDESYFLGNRELRLRLLDIIIGK